MSATFPSLRQGAIGDTCNLAEVQPVAPIGRSLPCEGSAEVGDVKDKPEVVEVQVSTAGEEILRCLLRKACLGIWGQRIEDELHGDGALTTPLKRPAFPGGGTQVDGAHQNLCHAIMHSYLARRPHIIVCHIQPTTLVSE